MAPIVDQKIVGFEVMVNYVVLVEMMYCENLRVAMVSWQSFLVKLTRPYKFCSVERHKLWRQSTTKSIAERQKVSVSIERLLS